VHKRQRCDESRPLILRVALDTPLRQVFDYLPPVQAALSVEPARGVRVRVPFGRRRMVGVLIETARDSQIKASKLKAALEILDQRSLFDPATFDLLCFAAEYYHHPLGEVMAAALPAGIRAGQAAENEAEVWLLTEAGRRALASGGAKVRAPRQRALLERLAQGHARSDQLAKFRPACRALSERGFVSRQRRPVELVPVEIHPSSLELTQAQRQAIEAVAASLGRFAAHLLHGVTGSGKTEVYLQVIARALARGGQVLVLVPEIALTPQLVERFERRFSAGVVVMHSQLSTSLRRDAWRAARGGQARIIIGTRSAVFTSLDKLSLIVVDEEHDASYKQQEGFRYSARDLAVWRAQHARIPVVLGSATPSLETLENVAQGRYSRLSLPQRPGASQAPRMSLVDLRRAPSDQGLSQPAILAIERHLGAGGQVIVFLNRRGYAPSLFCSACGWVASCAHCDARMTLHRRAAQLRCHHCGAHAAIPALCGRCGQGTMPVGQGTERVEEILGRLFPAAPLARLDRDTTGARGALHAVLERVRRGEARILVGTQMLTKGHDFPDVSLVVILDADQGLFASDYRATERLAQTITQVAGRAGRASRPGEVMVQTSFPEHPLLSRLMRAGYEGFAATALEERRDARWPPYSRLALFRAEAKDRARLDRFLEAAADQARAAAGGAVTVLGPAAALIARRADQFRAHLLFESASRPRLQRFLKRWLPLVAAAPGLRWSIDVDPVEVD
jgi:primosomal protein N' (replication factor Y) (superfamily II helicase)